MAYGLQIFNSSGQLRLDVTDKLTRLRYSTVATATDSGNVTLSDITGKSTIQFGIAMESNKCGHAVTRSGTTIYWVPKSSGIAASGDTYIVVFLYD